MEGNIAIFQRIVFPYVHDSKTQLGHFSGTLQFLITNTSANINKPSQA